MGDWHSDSDGEPLESGPVRRNPLSRRGGGGGGFRPWRSERSWHRYNETDRRWPHDRYEDRYEDRYGGGERDFRAARRRDDVARRDGLRVGYRVIVSGLNPRTPQHVVVGLFEQFGRVASCRLGRDPETQRLVGAAEIVYTSEHDAERAVSELRGATLDGHALNVVRSGKAFTTSGDGPRPRDGRPRGGWRDRGDFHGGRDGGRDWAWGRGGARDGRHGRQDVPSETTLDRELEQYMGK